jgi:hypothetical protein
MRYNLKKELKSAFDAPIPSRKDQFINQLDYPKSSRLDFIKSQIGYIRKRVWILSLLLFVGTLLGLYFSKAPFSMIWVVSSVLPFISLVSINEISRSITYNMDELEMSCKYNLLEVSLIRLGILGVTNLAVLIGILLLFMGKTDFGIIRLGLHLLTPYLLNCYGTLFAVNRLKSRETTYICGGVTAFVSILNTLLITRINEVYTESYGLFWVVSFIVLAVLSANEIVRLFKRMEELQWNSSLIV